jgi:hypothetical protein
LKKVIATTGEGVLAKKEPTPVSRFINLYRGIFKPSEGPSYRVERDLVFTAMAIEPADIARKDIDTVTDLYIEYGHKLPETSIVQVQFAVNLLLYKSHAGLVIEQARTLSQLGPLEPSFTDPRSSTMTFEIWDPEKERVYRLSILDSVVKLTLMSQRASDADVQIFSDATENLLALSKSSFNFEDHTVALLDIEEGLKHSSNPKTRQLRSIFKGLRSHIQNLITGYLQFSPPSLILIGEISLAVHCLLPARLSRSVPENLGSYGFATCFSHAEGVVLKNAQSELIQDPVLQVIPRNPKQVGKLAPFDQLTQLMSTLSVLDRTEPAPLLFGKQRNDLL